MSGMSVGARLPKITVLLVAAVLAAADRASAQGGPPLITDDPYTPGDGNWEVNVAVTFEQRKDERVLEAPLLDVNYGLGERLQLKVEAPWVTRTDRLDDETDTGPGNGTVGVKWRFLDERDAGVSVSVYPQLEFNYLGSSVDTGLASPGLQLLLPVQVARQFGPWGVNFEAGYNLVEEDEDEIIYGLAVSYEVSEALELLGEIHGAADQEFEEDELVFNLGARARLDDDITLLLAAGRSLRESNDTEPQFQVYVGLQFAF